MTSCSYFQYDLRRLGRSPLRALRRLKEVLLKTGRKTIVEAAPGDRIWGVGLAKSASEDMSWCDASRRC